MKRMLCTELSDREVYLIGSIVSQWGFVEADIFDQTLLSFSEEEALPKAMNNSQFSDVLKLWLSRVAERQDGERKAVLKAQYDEIVALNVYRQAVVHSRWVWRPDIPDEVTAVRVHGKSIKRVKFTADDLENFATRLGQLRYHLKYPGGLSDRAGEMEAAGFYISRTAWDLMSGRSSLGDLGLARHKDRDK